ncbi:hypothetical protein [Streptomyces sp. NPDC005752]|uniref:hypothetical protein n=1 Tax=Streptomyces sp. NPDC005752 TaxID=3157065 RepID=UPI0033F2C7F6
MIKKLASAIGAAALVAGGVLALGGTAAADPSCGYLVTPVSTSNGSKVYTEAPKCGQKVRAVANCLALGGAAKVYGGALSTAGYSTATCGSTTEVTQRGYQKYVSGSWGGITWYPKP